MNGNIQMKFLNHKKAFQSKVNRPLSNRLGGGGGGPCMVRSKWINLNMSREAGVRGLLYSEGVGEGWGESLYGGGRGDTGGGLEVSAAGTGGDVPKRTSLNRSM